MKIRTKEMSYEEVLKLPRPKQQHPKKPNLFFRTVMKVASIPDLRKAHFIPIISGMKLAI